MSKTDKHFDYSQFLKNFPLISDIYRKCEKHRN